MTRRLTQSPSMAKLALLVPEVELWLAELRPARGLPPHTLPGGAIGEGTGEGCAGAAGESGGGDTTAVSCPPVPAPPSSGGAMAGWPLAGGAPRWSSIASSASMAAVTFSRPPVITLSAPSGTLSTVSMISFLRSA